MSDNTDFFGQSNGDHTVFVPRPGNRRNRPASPNTPVGAPGPTANPGANRQSPGPTGTIGKTGTSQPINTQQTPNLLLSAATPLITLGTHLRNTNHVGDSNAVFQQTCADIKRLDERLQQAGVSKEHTVTTRYLICTFIDEMVMSTPWGAQSIWTQRSLLMTFHNNALGGVKFFEIVQLLLQNPASNIDLLELCYVMLNLGFEGKYRFDNGGHFELAQISENLYHAIQPHRPEATRELSPNVNGIHNARTLLADNRLMWGSLIAGISLSLIVFMSLFFTLNHASDPVAIQASAIGSNIEQLVRKPRATNTRTLVSELSRTLNADIESGEIAIKSTAEGIQIIVSGHGLFNPASAQISQNKRPLLKRIADAIAREKASILVVGHTDNEPIRTLQFPSNWQLSTKRAESIAEFLSTQLPEKNISTEGRADLQPLVPNNSAQNRAVNRRVEINLYLS
ncbi:putative lipoprotein YiaD [BD1-7 clade bacterium]|uniref:Putative lipoprotein YiaD n=1 Tax=BD1-7 clade bacterium TaxID=2029982 RepID=A0A5S9PXI8_9GAMM|nr:putative lipoprotein YiaD [BD1-7 clade bacterium]CAA0109364.1 putative lipoprotein YiaD [BD1-7 clade bacterium]